MEMIDRLLFDDNRSFISKCFDLMNVTRRSIWVLRGRAEARQRIMKEDLSKLLATGSDIKAYERTEVFLAGLNILSCYDFIEQSCNYVEENLAIMEYQSECPEECREAVGSLMFAARDLASVRDVRDLFKERYGSSLESSANQELAEKLSRPPQMKKRIPLLQDIASEYSIKWDSRGFEQSMTAPSTSAQAQANKYAHSKVAAGNRKTAKSDKDGALPKETSIVGNISQRTHRRRDDNNLRREEDRVLGRRGGQVKKDCSKSKVKQSSSSSNRKRLDNSGIAYTGQDDVKNDMHKRESWKALSIENTRASPSFEGIPVKSEDRLFAGKHGEIPGKDGNFLFAREHRNSRNEANLTRKVEELDGLIRVKDVIKMIEEIRSKRKLEKKTYDDVGSLRKNHNSVHEVNDSHRNHSELVSEGQMNESNRIRSHEKEQCYQDDKAPLPKTRSMRRKLYKSSSSHSDVNHVEDAGSVKNEDTLFAGKHGEIPGKDGNFLFAREHHNSRNEANLPRKVEELDGLIRVKDVIKLIEKTISEKKAEKKTYDDVGSSRKQHNSVHEVNGSHRNQREVYNPIRKGQINESTRERSHEKEEFYHKVPPLPNSSSMSRKHHKSSSRHSNVNDNEYLIKLIGKILLERKLEKKTYDDVGSSRKNHQSHPSHEGTRNGGGSSDDRCRDGYDAKAETILPYTRSVLLPREQSAPSEAKKMSSHTNSSQPVSPCASQVA